MNKKLRRILALLLTLALCIPSLTMANFAAEDADAGDGTAAEAAVTILYTNDVHSYIDEDLTYSMIAGYRNTLDNVLLVDAGDHIQGTAYGSMDNGETVIKIMNAAGYDLATLGNHEFDYGMDGAMNAIAWANFPYVSCNFYHEEDGVAGDNVLDSYQIFEVNGVRIALIGITTPESFTKSTPKYFQDDDGNYIYGIAGGTDGAELYAAVQQAIDAAAQEADYVIALGHLGIDASSSPWTSEEVIENTTGLDAFIDGHSHSTVEMESVTDMAGNEVILTQTGSYLAAVGQMTITTDGDIITELLTAEDLADVTPDADVAAIESEWVTAVDEQLGAKIASSDIDFTINDSEGNRAVRKYETNLGDFNADAYYWYLNEKEGLDCDVAVMNGGGIRASVDAGDWTYLTCKTVNTFGNVLCLVEITGQELLDALEFGARFTDESENGGFLHVAGLTYDVDTTVENTVQVDDKSVWIGGPEEYRVYNVQVYNKETGEYEDLDLEETYTVAGTNYTLRNCGDGFDMFADSVLVKDYISEDYMALAAYAMSFADTDEDGYADISTANSPLASYEGYLIDYEDADGAGRITLTEGKEISVVYGDVNQDEEINVEDALMVLQAYVNLIELDETQTVAADVDNNGVIDVTDALYILKYYVSLLNSLGPAVADEAIEWNGHYYYLYPSGTCSSWEEAKSYCESLGGYLAVISSEEENTTLYEYIRSCGVKNAYFGYSDSEEEGTWVWVPNEASSYTNWAGGEPNSESSGEDYAMFYSKDTSGRWNDGTFGGSAGTAFICEWNLTQ